MDVKDYAEQYARQYSGTNWFETVLVDARRQRVLESLDRYPHERILEVGCGLEPLFAHGVQFAGYTIVEPCVPFASKARELAAGRPDIVVLDGFLEDITFPADADFDFVIASSLLHEVPRPELFLECVRNNCRQSTVVHFNVPNVRSLHRLLALEMGLIADLFEQSETERRFQRTTRFDKSSFSAMLIASGFEILRLDTYFVKPFTHGQMERLFDERIVDRAAIRGLDRLTKYIPDVGAEMFAEVRRA